MFIPDNLYNFILECLPITCVDVLIVHQGKCLLLLRDNEPAKDTYWFPGGRINKNESIVKAALRKAKEETNLDCAFEKIISVEESMFKKVTAIDTDVHTVNICCLMRPLNIDDIQLDHLHKQYIWVNNTSNSYHSAVNGPLSRLGFQ